MKLPKSSKKCLNACQDRACLAHLGDQRLMRGIKITARITKATIQKLITTNPKTASTMVILVKRCMTLVLSGSTKSSCLTLPATLFFHWLNQVWNSRGWLFSHDLTSSRLTLASVLSSLAVLLFNLNYEMALRIRYPNMTWM